MGNHGGNSMEPYISIFNCHAVTVLLLIKNAYLLEGQADMCSLYTIQICHFVTLTKEKDIISEYEQCFAIGNFHK